MKRLFLLFVLFSSFASAADYYWFPSGHGEFKFSNPDDACRKAFDIWNASYPPGSYTYSRSEFSSETAYRCYLISSGSGNELTFGGPGWAYRMGDTCPTGTTYNAATGLCESDNLCQQAKGASTSYYVKTQLSANPPDQVDINGCLATFGGVITCRNTTDGYGVCTGTATITGEQTTTSSPIAGDPATVDDTPQVKSEELPCSPTTDPATGASVCTTQSTFSQPGDSTCGTVDGKLVCTEVVKSQSEDKVVQTKTQTTHNADGSTSKTTTTTTAKTSCVGINNCTSTTTTETKTGGTNADGSAKPDTSSCTGTGCTDPTKSDEEKAGEGLPSGELQKPKQGNYDDALVEWDQKIADAKQEFKDKLAQIKELATSSSALSLSAGGGQLPCPSFTVWGMSVDLCVSDYSSELAAIKWALLFIATVIAFYIIFLR